MYGIEKIGYGKKARYIIKQLVANGTNPVQGVKAHRTQNDAEIEAKTMGIDIIGTGDYYELLAMSRK